MTKPNNIQMRKMILLLINLLFYCLIDFKSLPILILLVCITFLCTKKNNKIFTLLGTIFTVFIWIFYKSFIKILPLGLSFYSFKIISYLIDNYKHKISFKQNFINYFIYGNENGLTLTTEKDKWLKGIQLIIAGLFLKFVIANRTAVYVNTVFQNYTSYTGLALFIAAILYSIQIYSDFSGYSNMSIGISNLLGIEVERNFNRPYFSKSIKEFWGRWHISLSSWLKDYIYIPLGGNRKGKFRKWLNSIITFLVSGFWHGNGSGYIFWGLYHGILNNLTPPPSHNKLKSFFYKILTFIEITIGWIFFRLESFSAGINYLKHMLSNFVINYNSLVNCVIPFTGDNASIAMAITLFILILFQFIIEIKNKEDYTKQKYCIRIFIYIVFIILFGVFTANKFIYMNY